MLLAGDGKGAELISGERFGADELLPEPGEDRLAEREFIQLSRHRRSVGDAKTDHCLDQVGETV